MSLALVPFSYPFPRPSVTCDAVIFTMRGDDLVVLLIQRKDEPFKGRWALPGGFVNDNESLERAAARELYEETGLSGMKLEQLGAFGDPGRDPRGHTITVAWLTYLMAPPKISAGDDAAAAEWHPFKSLVLNEPMVPSLSLVPKKGRVVKPKAAKVKRSSEHRIKLAFDHGKILSRAYARLLEYLDNPLKARSFALMPSRFTLAELRHFYEVILRRPITQRAFNKRLLEHDLVLPAATGRGAKTSTATQLYRWNRR